MPSPTELTIREIIDELNNLGFSTALYKEKNDNKYCFNIVATDNKRKFLIKYAEYFEYLTPKHSEELRIISRITKGSPLLLANKSKKGSLYNHVVYRRFKIYCITPKTFVDIFKKSEKLYVYAERGGFRVKIDSKKLRERREKEGFSLGEIAEKIGVSRKAIYDYERGIINMTPETAVKIERILNTSIVKEANIFSQQFSNNLPKNKSRNTKRTENTLIKRVILAFKKMHYNVFALRKSPFNLITASELSNYVIKIIDNYNEKNVIEANYTMIFAHLMRLKYLFVVKEKSLKKDFDIDEKGTIISLNELNKGEKCSFN